MADKDIAVTATLGTDGIGATEVAGKSSPVARDAFISQLEKLVAATSLGWERTSTSLFGTTNGVE